MSEDSLFCQEAMVIFALHNLHQAEGMLFGLLS